MCIFLLAAGLSLLNTSGSTAAQLGPVVLFVYLFTVAYSLGEGPIAFQYSAEVFPTIQREQGMAWAVCINNTFGKHIKIWYPRVMPLINYFFNSWCPWSYIPSNEQCYDSHRSLYVHSHCIVISFPGR